MFIIYKINTNTNYHQNPIISAIDVFKNLDSLNQYFNISKLSKLSTQGWIFINPQELGEDKRSI